MKDRELPSYGSPPPSHKGIPGNKLTDQAAKEALDEDISTTERYSPEDLKTEEKFKKRDHTWKMETTR
jgi:hypothetical protein